MGKNNESTHLIFDGEKIVISPNIVPILNFLSEIEKEVESLLEFQEKLNKIKKQHLETIDLVLFLSKKLKDNHINFEYTGMSEHPETIATKFNFDLPLRSQFIVLFASLEVLYFLDIAYNENIIDEAQIRKSAMDPKKVKKFINNFLLNNENKYFKDNIKRLSKLNSSRLRNLRNSLTHFFSIPNDSLSIMPSFLDEKARKLEQLAKQNKFGNFVCISPKDLYELIKSAHILRIKKWNDDSIKITDEFKKKMECVIKLVTNSGAITIHDKDLNI